MGENGKLTALKPVAWSWKMASILKLTVLKIYPAICLVGNGIRVANPKPCADFQLKRIVEETLTSDNGWILTKQTEKMCLQPGMFEEVNPWLFGQLGGRKAAETINKFLSTPDINPTHYISSSKGASTDPLHWFSF